MSRVGKLPVEIKKGVTVTINGQTINVSGPKGKLSITLPQEVSAKQENNEVVITPINKSKRARMMWGTARANLNNMVKGCAEGFSLKLEINGVGYRAQAQGKTLKLNLGYSHDVNFPIPEGVTIATPKPTELEITGADRRLIGQVAANIRSFRKPEPYKGKGIKYSTETIRRKEGKKK
ncbi:MAG: 50S ribosomal protein L6 [Proteobacteria bacterium]|nr:50S ribosomal protein L6 [Pseudomonadota bacterium]